MKPWSHLPNASLIDWVLESLRTDLGKWTAARTATWSTSHGTTHLAAWSAARDAARVTDLYAAWRADRIAAWCAALQATRDAERDGWGYTAWDEAGCAQAAGAVLALVAYDDCDQYLAMGYDELLTYAILSERPQAVLLLPLKWIQEHECLVTLA